MKRVMMLAVVAGTVGCRENATEPGAPLTVEIVAPSSTDSIYDLDSLLLLGTATASTIGVIPDDSLWWTDNGDTLGYGSRIEAWVLAGTHQLALHARYGPSHDSAHRAIEVQSGLGRALWSVPLGSPSYSSGLTLLAGRALVAREGATDLAIIGTDGSVIAREVFNRQLSESPVTATTDGGFIAGYVAGHNASIGGILRFQADGAMDWDFNIGQQGTGFHHVHGGASLDPAGTAYFISGELQVPIWAVNADGTLRWRTETQPDGPGSNENVNWTVLVGDSLVVAPLRRDSIVALSAVDGTRRWLVAGGRRNWGYTHFVAAVDGCGTVYTAGVDSTTQYPGLLAITPDGNVAWMISDVGFPTRPVIGASHIYLAWTSGTVLAISLDGMMRDTLGTPTPWFTNGTDAGVTLGANDVLYVTGIDTLYSFTADGTRRFAVAIDSLDAWAGLYGPVIGGDGTLYLRTGSGVTAFRDTVGPSTDAPWPTFQGNFQRTGRVANGTCTR